jgi:hypothetical protein
MSLLEEQLEEIKRRTAAVGVTPEMAQVAAAQPEPVSQDSLLPVPMSPIEKMMERDGKLKTMGKMLLGGFTGMTPFLMPELIGGKARYQQELKDYSEQQKMLRAQEALSGIDMQNITASDAILLDAAGLGDYANDAFAAQQNSSGGDESIREHFGYSPYQWSQLSPEAKRDLRDRYAYGQTGPGTFDYRLRAEGKSPEQLQAAKTAEAEGTGRGNEITSDRQTVTGIRRQIKGIDQGIKMVGDVRELIATRQADPGKFRAGMRNVFGVETYEDGRMSATAAQGVIDQLREVTLGAISESELKLLLGGLLDPSRSAEANLGTLDTALERMESNKGLAIDDARLAWERLASNEGQADFLSQATEDDWYFNNLGEGRNFKPVPKADGSGEVSFSQYSENVIRNFKKQNPYAELPTRDDLIVGFDEFRQQQEKLWTAEQERKKAEAERLELAKKGLTETPLIFREAGNQAR